MTGPGCFHGFSQDPNQNKYNIKSYAVLHLNDINLNKNKVKMYLICIRGKYSIIFNRILEISISLNVNI